MGRVSVLVAILLTALGAAGARAAPIIVGQAATLTLEISDLPPIVLASPNGELGTTVAPGAFAFLGLPFGSGTLHFTAPGFVSTPVRGPLALQVSLASVGSGFFSLSGGPAGGAGGVFPILGALRITLPSSPDLEVPLTVIGGGGSVGDARPPGLFPGISLALSGAAWTTGVVVVTGVTTPSGLVNTVTRTGSAVFGEVPTFAPTTLTNEGEGADPVHNFLRLVAPMPIVINGHKMSGFATFEMLVLGQVLVPEPTVTSLALLGFALAALIASRKRL